MVCDTVPVARTGPPPATSYRAAVVFNSFGYGMQLYGSDAAAIKQTVVAGRNGQMPAWGEKLGEQRVKLLAAYVTKLAQEGSR